VRQSIGITVPEAVRTEVFAMARRGESYETISRYMAGVKLEKILAIRLLSEAAHLRLGEAKKIIHLSPAWKFRRASDEEFQAEALYAVETGRPMHKKRVVRAEQVLKVGNR